MVRRICSLEFSARQADRLGSLTASSLSNGKQSKQLPATLWYCPLRRRDADIDQTRGTTTASGFRRSDDSRQRGYHRVVAKRRAKARAWPVRIPCTSTGDNGIGENGSRSRSPSVTGAGVILMGDAPIGVFAADRIRRMESNPCEPSSESLPHDCFQRWGSRRRPQCGHVTSWSDTGFPQSGHGSVFDVKNQPKAMPRGMSTTTSRMDATMNTWTGPGTPNVDMELLMVRGETVE